MTHAGQLRDRATFQRKAQDAHSRRTGAWGEDIVRDCAVRYLRAGETVLEARLQGVQTAVLTVRPEGLDDVDNGWRATVRDARTLVETVFDIKGRIPNGDYVDFTAQSEGNGGGV